MKIWYWWNVNYCQKKSFSNILHIYPVIFTLNLLHLKGKQTEIFLWHCRYSCKITSALPAIYRTAWITSLVYVPEIPTTKPQVCSEDCLIVSCQLDYRFYLIFPCCALVKVCRVVPLHAFGNDILGNRRGFSSALTICLSTWSAFGCMQCYLLLICVSCYLTLFISSFIRC
jgi:hypothetical protein